MAGMPTPWVCWCERVCHRPDVALDSPSRAARAGGRRVTCSRPESRERTEGPSGGSLPRRRHRHHVIPRARQLRGPQLRPLWASRHGRHQLGEAGRPSWSSGRHHRRSSHRSPALNAPAETPGVLPLSHPSRPRAAPACSVCSASLSVSRFPFPGAEEKRSAAVRLPSVSHPFFSLALV